MERERLQPARSLTKNRRAVLWFPPVALAFLIFLLSSTPGHLYPRHPDLLNNLVHFVEFGLLAFLLARAILHEFRLRGTVLLALTTLLCASLGLMDELHQFLVPERMFDLMDVLFDTMGAMT